MNQLNTMLYKQAVGVGRAQRGDEFYVCASIEILWSCEVSCMKACAAQPLVVA
jgi:hypothetical protein